MSVWRVPDLQVSWVMNVPISINSSVEKDTQSYAADRHRFSLLGSSQKKN